MAVHIQYPDGTRQWVPGQFKGGEYLGKTAEGWARFAGGFVVFDTRAKIDRAFACGHSVLCITDDARVYEWRRYRPSSPACRAIYCEDWPPGY